MLLQRLVAAYGPIANSNDRPNPYTRIEPFGDPPTAPGLALLAKRRSGQPHDQACNDKTSGSDLADAPFERAAHLGLLDNLVARAVAHCSDRLPR